MAHEARLSVPHPNWAENWSSSTYSPWPKGWRGECHCRPTGWGPQGGCSLGAHSHPEAADCVSGPRGPLGDWSVHCPGGICMEASELQSEVNGPGLAGNDQTSGGSRLEGWRLRAEVTAICLVLHTPAHGAGLGDRPLPPFSEGHGCPPYTRQGCAP